MNNKFLLFIFLAISQLALAQKFSIKGQVVDTVSSPMPMATVMLMNPKDSSLVNFGVTNSTGNFELKNVSKGDYQLKITFIGLAPYAKNLSPSNFTTPVMEMGQLKLKSKTNQLDEMVIHGDKAPITFKRDTIEYNASSFKTKTNANVEDLLKRMPGIDVQSDGSIKAQGETVQRVTVDGREFFGRDPKLATRNLPADAVEKVQVFDKKSDQAAFTGIDDGQREKTINLELKESKRNGAFGNITAGVGNKDRWTGKASLNKFGKGQQLSFLGMGNNINEQGFSLDDYMNFSGGSQQMMGGGGGGGVRIQLGGDNSSGVPMNFGGRQNGINTNYAGGLNFNKDLSKDTKLTSSYFFNRLNQRVMQDVNRINYLPNDSSYNFTQNSNQYSTSDNHRVNLALDHQIDSANSIRFTTAVTYTTQDIDQSSSSKTMLTDGRLANESNTQSTSSSENMNLNSNLLYRHRFAKKGRTVSTNLSLGITSSDAEGTLGSLNKYYTEGKEKLIDQLNTTDNQSQTYGATIAYTEPLGNRKYLELNYAFRTNRSQVDKEVTNIRNGQRVFNDTLSNKYNSAYLYNRPGANFKLNRTKFSLTVGTSYQMTRLKGNLILKDTTINRSFSNLLPVAHFNYDFSSVKHFRFDYETSMSEPSITQLQPVVDNSDPLNLSVGNPELKPGYAHRFSTNYTQFDPGRFIGFFAFVNATYTTNAISNSQSVDPKTFIRTTRPVNVDNNFNANGNFNLGFPIKKLNGRFSIGPSSSFAKTINMVNEADNISKSLTLGGNVRYDYTLKEILTVGVSANLSQQKTTYSLNTQDQRYLNETYSSEANVNFLKNYSYNVSFDFYRYNSQTTDFSQTIPMLNMSLSRFVFKAKSGEIKLGVVNLLDKSLSVSQTANSNYLQQTTTNNLGRYVMASFTYSLNKQLNPMGGGGRRGGGGMRMMIRN